jgi:multisubunit Na+/H+ antiporter MnhE subunit
MQNKINKTSARSILILFTKLSSYYKYIFASQVLFFILLAGEFNLQSIFLSLFCGLTTTLVYRFVLISVDFKFINKTLREANFVKLSYLKYSMYLLKQIVLSTFKLVKLFFTHDHITDENYRVIAYKSGYKRLYNKTINYQLSNKIFIEDLFFRSLFAFSVTITPGTICISMDDKGFAKINYIANNIITDDLKNELIALENKIIEIFLH